MLIKNLLNLTTDAFIIVREDQIIETANNAALEFLGYQENDLVGQNINWLFDDPNNGKVPTSENHNMTGSIRVADGRRISVTYSSTSIPGQNGDGHKIAYVIRDSNGHNGHSENITSIGSDTTAPPPRKKKRTGLFGGIPQNGNGNQTTTKQIDARYRWLFEQSPVMMHRVDAEGKVVEVNEQWLQNLGYERHEALGRDTFSFMTESSRQYALEVVLPELREKQIVRNVPYTFVKKNGDTLDVLLTGTVHYDDEGNLLDSLAIAIDITERNQANEALRRQRDFNRTIIEASPAFFVAISAAGKVELMNNAMLTSLGYERDEVIGVDYMSTFVPEDEREALGKIFEKLVASAEPTLNQNYVLTKDGERRLVEWHGRPVFNENDEFDYFFGFGIDITEREKAAQTLRESEERFRTLIEYAPEAMVVLDADTGLFIDVNTNATKLFGKSRETLLQLSPVHLSPEYQLDGRPSLDVVREYTGRALQGEIPVFEWLHLNDDGEEILCEIRLVKLPGEDNLIRGSIIDIGERKRAEAEIKKRIDEINRIYQTSANLLGTVNSAGYFVSLNPAWEEILGFTLDELRERPYTEFIHPDDLEMTIDAVGKMAEGLEAVQFENRYLHKDGTYRWLSWHARPKVDEGLIYFAAYDITERKQTEEELERLVNELQQRTAEALEASRLKSDFLATMSHELRTPLNSTIGFGGILLEGMAGNMDDMARNMVQNMYDSSQHLLSLIDDILDIAKIEAGRFDLVEVPFDVRELAKKWKQQLLVQAKAKGVQFEVTVASNVPKQLVGDAERITQIAHNLLTNALKFTDEGSVRLRMEYANEQTIIRVTDTGIGIPPHALDYIFDEFRQVDSSSQRIYGGTGLGLAIVRKICVAMGGEVNVSSTLHKGSTFTVTLPLKQYSSL